MSYLDKETPITEMENSLNEEVVSKVMTCNELDDEEKKVLDKWLDSVMESANERNERNSK